MEKPWKFCPQCGTSIGESFKFCSECGEPVSHEARGVREVHYIVAPPLVGPMVGPAPVWPTYPSVPNTATPWPPSPHWTIGDPIGGQSTTVVGGAFIGGSFIQTSEFTVTAAQLAQMRADGLIAYTQ